MFRSFEVEINVEIHLQLPFECNELQTNAGNVAMNSNQDNGGWWNLNVGDASLHTGAEVSLKLKALTGERVEQAIKLDFIVSNNKTKYEAILAEVDLAQSIS